MIGYDEVTACGSVLHTHGVGGEVVVPVPDDLFESSPMPLLVLEMDGILVPFFIESHRNRSGSSSLVKFEGVGSLEEAVKLVGHKVWILNKFMDNSDSGFFTPDMLVGLRVSDKKAGELGVVEAVDDRTQNTLLMVRDAKGCEHILPVNPDLVEYVDFQKGIVSFVLPEGLLGIN